MNMTHKLVLRDFWKNSILYTSYRRPYGMADTVGVSGASKDSPRQISDVYNKIFIELILTLYSDFVRIRFSIIYSSETSRIISQ